MLDKIESVPEERRDHHSGLGALGVGRLPTVKAAASVAFKQLVMVFLS
jgi:hypothetical protein